MSARNLPYVLKMLKTFFTFFLLTQTTVHFTNLKLNVQIKYNISSTIEHTGL